MVKSFGVDELASQTLSPVHMSALVFSTILMPT